MGLTLFLYSFALLLVLGVQKSLTDNSDFEQCIRKDGKLGYCVHYQKCELINNIVKKHRLGISTADELSYYRISGCPVNKQNHVCCENDNVWEGIQLLLSQNCGNFSEVKAVGGDEVDLMSRPWMALLKFNTEYNTEAYMCGGTIINERYILTAAHCFMKSELISVRLGEHNITSDVDCGEKHRKPVCAPKTEDIDFEKVIVHRGYSEKEKVNDIALVKLSRDVKFKKHIYPICLPLNKTLPATLTHFRITGWGATEDKWFSDVPMETLVSKRDRSECEESFRRQLTSKQLCAGDRGKDSCNGDSGGPLLYLDRVNGIQRLIQFGIVSYGSPKCGDVYPGVYTNVGQYIHWIAENIASN